MEILLIKNRKGLDKITGIGTKFGLMLPVLLAIVCFFVAFSENSLAFLLFNFFWVSLGTILSVFISTKEYRSKSVLLFLSFYTIYISYMLITNYTYIKDPFTDCFYNPDSIKFFSRIDFLSKVASPNNMYGWMDGFYIGDWKGFGAIIWTIARVTNKLGEANSLLIQKLQIVFLCSATIMVLFNLCLRYFTFRRAYRLAIIFGLLSHIMAFSGIFMRDVYIVFIYTLGFHVVLNKWNLTGVIILVLLGLFAWQIRTHNGIFFIAFIFLSVYMRIEKRQPRLAKVLLFGSLLITLAAAISINLSAVTGDTSEELATYQAYHEGKLQESTGLTGAIMKAPTFVRPLLFVGLSQVYPFPPYRGMYVDYLDDYQYLLFPLSIAEIFWIYIIIYLIYGLWQRKYRLIIPRELGLCLILSIFYILAAGSTSYEFRRLMAVYPIIFLCACFLYEQFPKVKQKLLNRRISIGYIGILTLYLVMKFLR